MEEKDRLSRSVKELSMGWKKQMKELLEMKHKKEFKNCWWSVMKT